MKAYLQFVRIYFRLLSRFAPGFAASMAFRLFQKPKNRIIRPLEKTFLQNSKSFKITHKPETIDCYELGKKGDPVVILVHGWESNAGSMAAIAASLADQGYRAITFNLPAHGQSRLKYANLLSCSQSLETVLQYFRYSGPISIIAHSFGSAVATYTLAKTEVPVEKFIMLSTPDKIIDIFNEFRQIIGLGNEAFEKMLQHVQNLLGQDLESVAINELTQKVSYKELSIIHDEFDKVLPYSNSLNVYKKARKAKLTTLEKVGHYKMLWNNYVIRSIMLDLGPRRKKAA